MFEKYRKWQLQQTAHKMVHILNQAQYDAHYAETLTEARELLFSMIPEGVSIGMGGSTTLSSMNVLETLRNGKYQLIDRFASKSWEEENERYRQALHADYFISGANAITKTGEIVNRDSSGNRVAALIYGPSRVILVVGANKVVDTLDDAFARLRKIAPLNCNRIGHKTPCAVSGECEDCYIPDRMCNYTGIIHHGMKKPGRITVIMVAEDLGF